MKTSLRLLVACGLLAGISASCGAADPASRPNILILFADDLGYADLGVYGCEDFATPNIDSIAHKGVRFTSGYVSAPVCSPSRAGLLSGRWQTRFGHELNHCKADAAPFGLPPGVKTFAQWFKESGYATGHIGKWHLGTMARKEFRPENRGFDVSVWFEGQKKTPPLYFFRHAPGEPPGEVAADKRAQQIAEFYIPEGDAKRNEVGRTDDSYVDLAMSREASQFITANKSQPWFLYMAFLTPHDPLAAPPGAEEPFAKISSPKRRTCAAMMTLLDQSVGDILRTLRETGQEERTLIVFLSDNGAIPSNGSRCAPLRGWKGTLWEGGIREPFLMRWTGGGIPAGRVIDAPVSSLDILPTALAAAGITPPPDAPLDGSNLLPFLMGKTENLPHDALYWRYGDDFAIRRGDWKLVRTYDADGKHDGPLPPVRLFNLKEDIGETQDLSAANPEKTGELLEQWNTWNAGNIDPLWQYDSP